MLTEELPSAISGCTRRVESGREGTNDLAYPSIYLIPFARSARGKSMKLRKAKIQTPGYLHVSFVLLVLSPPTPAS